MNIFNYFKKIGIDTVDPSFYRKIEEWKSWYNGNVRRFSFYKVYTGRGTYKRCQRKSMGMAKKLSEDIADLLLNERVTITLNDENTNNFVQKALEDTVYVMNVYSTLYNLAPEGAYAVSYEWDDSLITNPDEELQRRLTLANAGVESRINIRMWYYGETKEQAEQQLALIDQEQLQQAQLQALATGLVQQAQPQQPSPQQ